MNITTISVTNIINYKDKVSKIKKYSNEHQCFEFFIQFEGY